MPFLTPQGDRKVVPPKKIQEPLLRGFGRTLPIQTVDPVVRNQVDLGLQAGRVRGERNACSSVSFTPHIIIYSKVMRCFLREE